MDTPITSDTPGSPMDQIQADREAVADRDRTACETSADVGGAGVGVDHDPKETWDAVLLDDDVLVHMSWKMAAKMKGKTLLPFDQLDALMAAVHRFDLKTPIYVDSNLGKSTPLKGEEVLEKLHQLGFRDLYLTTGYHVDTIDQRFLSMMTVMGKDPPWDL
jgi:hypothetical protein